MIELLLAGMCALSSWIAFSCVAHRDPVVVARLAQFRPPPAVSNKPRPSLFVQLFNRVGKKFPGNQGKAGDVTDNLGGVDPATLRGARLCCAVFGFTFGLLSGPMSLLMSPALAAMGYRIPKFAVSRRIARRNEQVATALPDALDLLAVCTHAGLNLSLSLQRVAGRTRGALGDELSRMLAEIEMGVPRQVAMRSLAERHPNGDLEALIGVLETAERFGTQVSDSLESFATEVRGRRRRSAEEQARKAPVKILFPLIFLILPAFILLSVVPLMLGAFSALKF